MNILFYFHMIDFPKGDHRRPPAFVIRRFGDKVFGFLRFRRCWQYGVFWDSSYAQLKGLGASGVALGASWGALGGVLVPLGRLLGRLKGDAKKTKHSMQKRSQQGGHRPNLWAPQRKPKSSQNGTPNATKFKTIFKSEKVALQEPLGAVLGRSWGILEAILGSPKSLRYRQA